MPKLDGTGPDGTGPQAGRRLGDCSGTSDEEKRQKLGKGMGKKRNAGGGVGLAKRLQSDKRLINK